MTPPIPTKQPALSTNPDYSRALYYDPPSHDFCSWLMMAEMMRRHHNAPAPLKVRFALIDGQLGKIQFGPLSPWMGRAYECGVSRAYSDEMIANVLRPAIAMIGGVEEPALDSPWPMDELRAGRYVEYDHHVSLLVDASRAGHAVPKWQIPQWAHDEVQERYGGARPIVITLREVRAQPERNSQVQEWLKFARSIPDDHPALFHPVLFVRDTAKAHEPLSGFNTFPRASENVYVRAALYQRALVNLMVGNGPIEWCLFSDAPFLCFKQLIPALPNWQGGQPEGWREQCHLEVGEQLPWSTPQQRLTWMDDSFEHIAGAFADFVRRAAQSTGPAPAPSAPAPSAELGAGRWNAGSSSPAP